MINYVMRDSRRRPLLHTLCVIVLVFSITISPITVFAVDNPAQTVSAMLTTSTPSSTVTTPSINSSTVAPVTNSVTPTTTLPTSSADTPSSTTSAPTPTPKASTSQGPQSPTGVDNTTYSFNSTTGLWENANYTWNPATNQTKPKVAPTYSYNPATGRWDTTQWRYDAPSGKYVENIISSPTLPAGATINSSSTTGDSPSTKSLASSPPNADGTITTNPKSSGIFDQFYNASISNRLNSQATTGDATVTSNTLAGNAISGTATAIATVLNLLQSSWNYVANGGLTTFVSNMFGNIFGDLMINPGTLASTAAANTQNPLTVNSTGSGQITNNLTLGATSGNTAVTNNTKAGDANSGNANAIANIINSIGSTVSAGKSFLGVLNIFGNLNGDILLPSQLLSLLGPHASTSTQTTAQPSSLNTTTNQVINNNVNSGAASGTASVANNTTSGNATTGSGSTNLNILNLTGRQVIGKDALLVFVNVLGKWVGIIVDNPAGTKTAALGDSSSSSTVTTPSKITTTDNQNITNNLALTAQSGNASVNNNTSAGNATSGSASTTANIVNMENSNLSLTGWFGILFINIFGNWYGSFGVNTAAGDVPTSTSPTIASQTSATTSNQSQSLLNSINHHASTFSYMANSDNQGGQTGTVLASNTSKNNSSSPAKVTKTQKTNPPTNSNMSMFSVVGAIFGISIITGERVYSYRDKIRLLIAK